MPGLLNFTEACMRAWEETWKALLREMEGNGILGDELADEDLLGAVRDSINSKTKTYRYVLPTQLIAKYVDPSLDSLCIQVQRGGKGAFDARTIAHKVIVPFDKGNPNVLGGSPEPYVNNPLRVPEISLEAGIRNQQKDKQGWDNLYKVLERVEDKNSKEFTGDILRQTQIEILKRLHTTSVDYPVPIRISLAETKVLLVEFLKEKSGGDRPEVVATALFRVMGHQFSLFSEVRRSRTNAPDAASGQVADIECLDQNGIIVLAVEVKDSDIRISHISDKIGRAREENIAEFLFLVRRENGEFSESVRERINAEFTSGQNIYVFDISEFVNPILVLLGEKGRTEFLREVGKVMEEYSSSFVTRKHWSELLKKL